jgi:predicted RNA methylase
MDIFSNLMVIGECLLDKRRTKAFKRALERTVNQGDIVLDVGTGSGALAMFAAKNGAKKVYAVEIADDVAKFANQNVKANSLSHKIDIINSDMKTLKFSHKVDVVIMELLDTGLISEQEAIVINRMHSKGIITSKTKLIPYRYQCAFELVQYDFNFYGLEMPFIIQARNFAAIRNIKNKLSKTTIYKDIDFSKIIDTDISMHINVETTASGVINALVLKSKTFLSKEVSLWGTTDMNMPVIIPLREKKVNKGEKVKVHLKYKMGEGFGNFFASL